MRSQTSAVQRSSPYEGSWPEASAAMRASIAAGAMPAQLSEANCWLVAGRERFVAMGLCQRIGVERQDVTHMDASLCQTGHRMGERRRE